MYEQRTAGILSVVVVIGTILQLIGLFTPGWSIVSSTLSDSSTSTGIWFYRSCDWDGKCETNTYYEDYTKALEKNPKSSAAISYAVTVGAQVIGLLSLVCCIVSCGLSFAICRCGTKNYARKSSLALLMICFLLVAGSLIWTIIGERAALIAASARRMDDDSTVTIGFPYSLFLSAIGSALTTLVAVINIGSLLKAKRQDDNSEAYEVPDTTAPVQINHQYNQHTVMQQGYMQPYKTNNHY